MDCVVLIFAIIYDLVVAERECDPSVTTASGSFAPLVICPGDLIFQEEFDHFNFQKWQHDNTLAGGGNGEFQWYNNNRSNSFVHDGVLYIKPTLTADHLGYDSLYKDTLDLNGDSPADTCTNPAYDGCIRQGTSEHILNPIKSASIRTVESFSFKYGRIIINAKMPAGDWLWPAIWLIPRYNVYGAWPTSGAIDIVESRGNRNLTFDDQQIGTQLVTSTLHWGPDCDNNGFQTTCWDKMNAPGFDKDYHLYETYWTPSDITFYVDGQQIGKIVPPPGGFWELGEWGHNFSNPWQEGNVMAPFDQEFYIVINNAVGGNSYFPDTRLTENVKPWKNNSPRAATDFWENRNMWLDTWTLDQNNDAALQVDYVRIYAI